jgi:hypothetical protein
MPIPASINDLSTTAGSNSPAGSESPSLIDDYLRTYASYIADLRDRTNNHTFGTGYIDGLLPTWNSSSSITVSPGTACIPSTGNNITAPFALTLSGLSLAANTWYYLYIYDNSGTAAIELVSTAPTAPYNGTARGKSGDLTRRFLCALRSNSGSGLLSFQADSTGIMRYRELLSAAPFRIVAGANQTVPTTVGTNSIVPPTTQTAVIIAVQSGSTAIFLGLPADAAAVFNRVAAATQVALVVILDSGRQFSFWNASAGGAATFDVAGYGMER